MADKKISEETAAAALTGAELVLGVQAGANVGITVDQIAAFAVDGIEGGGELDSDLAQIAGLSPVDGEMLQRLGGVWTNRRLAPKRIAGRYYLPGFSPVGAGAAVGTTLVRMIPFTVDAPMTVSELWARVTTAAAGGLFGIAYYAADANDNPTGAPVASVLGLSTATAGSVAGALAGPVALAPGRYFMAVSTNAAAAVFMTRLTGDVMGLYLIGHTDIAAFTGNTARHSLSFTHAYGTWPDLTGATLSTYVGANDAVVGFRVAA